jgi:hypothetical protein
MFNPLARVLNIVLKELRNLLGNTFNKNIP